MAIQRIARHALKISRYRQCVLTAASRYTGFESLRHAVDYFARTVMVLISKNGLTSSFPINKTAVDTLRRRAGAGVLSRLRAKALFDTPVISA